MIQFPLTFFVDFKQEILQKGPEIQTLRQILTLRVGLNKEKY